MKNNVSQGRFSFLYKAQLAKMKLRAMRAGVWFRGLPRIDRVLIDLTMQVTDSIRSVSLFKCVLSIEKKLEELLESRFSRAIREIGVPTACRLSSYAREWGNAQAVDWASDAGFARYLAVMKLNGHSYYAV